MGYLSVGLRCLLLISVVLVVIDLAECRRYGGGSRYSSSRYSNTRYSRSRYSSNRFRSTRYRIRNSGSSRIRVRYGASGRYHGVYIGGYYHHDGYGHDFGGDDFEDYTICKNYADKDGNGTSIGKFLCPMYGEPDDFTYCCGSDDQQYCCDFWGDAGRKWGLIIGVVVGVLLLSLVVYFCSR